MPCSLEAELSKENVTNASDVIWRKLGEMICVTTITALKTVLVYFDLYTRKRF